jgi:hypothetical protein
MSEHPVRLILIGFVLVLAGAVFPLLMVSKVLESTFFLNIASYTASTAGLFLGIIGGAMYVKKTRKPPRNTL